MTAGTHDRAQRRLAGGRVTKWRCPKCSAPIREERYETPYGRAVLVGYEFACHAEGCRFRYPRKGG